VLSAARRQGGVLLPRHCFLVVVMGKDDLNDHDWLEVMGVAFEE
jgi:hypothetical protein